MSDDEDAAGDEDWAGSALTSGGRRATVFLLDASDEMLNEDEDGSSAFQQAVKTILDYCIEICLSEAKSFSQHVGVLVLNVKTGGDRFHFVEWIPIGALSQDSCRTLNDFLAKGSARQAVTELWGGVVTGDFSAALWHCARAFVGLKSHLEPTSNQTKITYHAKAVLVLTNRVAPFSSAVGTADQSQHSLALRQSASLRKSNAEIFVLLVPPLKSRSGVADSWRAIDPQPFIVPSFDQLIFVLKSRVPPSRATTLIPFSILPGVDIGVKILNVVSEAKKPTGESLHRDTEQPLKKRTVFYEPNVEAQSVDDMLLELPPSEAGKEHAKSELRSVIQLGNQTVVMDSARAPVKNTTPPGLTLLGFKPIDSIKVWMHLSAGKLVVPDEDKVVGSRRLYRTLLEECAKRQEAAICRFTAKAQQTMRLVALIPQLTDDSAESAVGSQLACTGFHMFQLPFAEFIRELDEVLAKKPAVTPDASDVDVFKPFVSRLTAAYHVDNFKNPVMSAFHDMLVSNVLGDERTSDDTIKPYFADDAKRRRVEGEAAKLKEHFHLG